MLAVTFLPVSSSDDSSEEDEGGRSRQRCRGGQRSGAVVGSEDEFEREMESELMSLMETVASPDALVAVAASQSNGG